jgi:hypothetical protein
MSGAITKTLEVVTERRTQLNPKEVYIMTAIAQFVDRNHKAIVYAQFGLILFFLLACTFNGVLPICHWLFNCDHMVIH